MAAEPKRYLLPVVIASLLAESACGTGQPLPQATCLATALGEVLCAQALFSDPAPTNPPRKPDPTLFAPTAMIHVGVTQEPTQVEPTLSPSRIISDPVMTPESHIITNDFDLGDLGNISQPKVIFEGNEDYKGQARSVNVTYSDGQSKREITEVVSTYFSPRQETDGLSSLQLAQMAVLQDQYRNHPNQIPDRQQYWVYLPTGAALMGYGQPLLDPATYLDQDAIRNNGPVDFWVYLPIPEKYRGDLLGHDAWVKINTNTKTILDNHQLMQDGINETWLRLDSEFNLQGDKQFERPDFLEVSVSGLNRSGIVYPGTPFGLSVLVNSDRARSSGKNPQAELLRVERAIGNSRYLHDLFDTMSGYNTVDVKIGFVDELGNANYTNEYLAQRGANTSLSNYEINLQTGGQLLQKQLEDSMSNRFSNN